MTSSVSVSDLPRELLVKALSAVTYRVWRPGRDVCVDLAERVIAEHSAGAEENVSEIEAVLRPLPKGERGFLLLSYLAARYKDALKEIHDANPPKF